MQRIQAECYTLPGRLVASLCGQTLSIDKFLTLNFSLAIMTPNIPSSGTKSRVETQVRVQLDLTLGSCSSGDPFRYDKVGSWKWLKLPKGTATRKRSRKDGKIGMSRSIFEPFQ